MPACVGQREPRTKKSSARSGKQSRQLASDEMANIHPDKRPLREKFPGLPELTDRLAKIAKQPNNDTEEREATQAIQEIAAHLKHRFYREPKRDPYEVPELSTSGLTSARRDPGTGEVVEELWG
jgi:hypothetical protein